VLPELVLPEVLTVAAELVLLRQAREDRHHLLPEGPDGGPMPPAAGQTQAGTIDAAGAGNPGVAVQTLHAAAARSEQLPTHPPREPQD
jgi:hypothetical protein